MTDVEFLVTSLIVILIPGTGVIFTVSTGLFMGWRASIVAALGCTAGIIPHLLASVIGLSAVWHMSALAFHAIKLAGAAYLLYLAWSMWHEKGAVSFSKPLGSSSLRSVFVRAFWMNILNPKLSIFFLAFLPHFVTADAVSPVVQMLGLSAVFMVMTFVVFVAYGLFAYGVRSFVIQSARFLTGLQRSFAAVFAVLGINLALSDAKA